VLSVALIAAAIGTSECATIPHSLGGPPRGEWPTYGGTYANARYSALDQITRDNVSRLQIAWRWTSPDHAVMDREPRLETFLNEGTPIMVDGTLYVSTSLSQAAAIDAATGHTLWVYDPQAFALGDGHARQCERSAHDLHGARQAVPRRARRRVEPPG
jgi:glucose dehydrogenase